MALFRKDIDKRYSEIISNYLAKDYTFYTKSMGGSQGDICKIDITNGIEILRIRIDTTNRKDFENNYNFRYDSIKIEIERYTKSKDKYLFNRETIWNDNGEIIHKEIFYVIKGKENVYTKDFNFALDCNKMHCDRLENRRKESFKKIKFDADKIIKIVNNKKGYKSVKKKDIESVIKQYSDYIIRIKDKKSIIIEGYKEV